MTIAGVPTDVLRSSDLTWESLANKPLVFPPSAHAHSAADITSGTLSDNRLSANVPRLNAVNVGTLSADGLGTHRFGPGSVSTVELTAGAVRSIASGGSYTEQTGGGVRSSGWLYLDSGAASSVMIRTNGANSNAVQFASDGSSTFYAPMLLNGATPLVNLSVTAGTSSSILRLTNPAQVWDVENQYVGGASVGMFRVRNNTLGSDSLTIHPVTNAVSVSGNLLLGTTQITNQGFGRIDLGYVGNANGMVLEGYFAGGYVRMASAHSVQWTAGNDATNAGGVTRISQQSAGVVQIGTTSNNALGSLALANLTASGTIQSTGGVIRADAGTGHVYISASSSGTGVNISNDTVGGENWFVLGGNSYHYLNGFCQWATAAGSQIMLLDQSGNLTATGKIGIGNASTPAYALHVGSSSSSANQSIGITTPSGAYATQLYGNDVYHDIDTSSGSVIWRAGGVEKVRFSSAGNVIAAGNILLGGATSANVSASGVGLRNNNFLCSSNVANNDAYKLIGMNASNQVLIDLSGLGVGFGGGITASGTGTFGTATQKVIMGHADYTCSNYIPGRSMFRHYGTGAVNVTIEGETGDVSATGYFTSLGYYLKAGGTNRGLVYFGSGENRFHSYNNEPWVVNSDTGFKVRNAAGNSDAPLTAGAITVSTSLGFSQSRFQQSAAQTLQTQCYDTSLAAWQETMKQQASPSGAKWSVFGATPVVQQTLPAAATDAATTQTLCNAIRTLLLNFGFSN